MTLPQFQFPGHHLYVVTQNSSLKLSSPLPFLSPYHVFWTDRANDVWHLYKLTKLLWVYKCSFQGALYGICVIKGHLNLWHQLAYKAWERKNWLTIMSCSSFKFPVHMFELKLALADVHRVCEPSDDWWETNEDENLSRFVTLSATHLTSVSKDFMQPLHTLRRWVEKPCFTVLCKFTRSIMCHHWLLKILSIFKDLKIANVFLLWHIWIR
jgi:hypothetical protein